MNIDEFKAQIEPATKWFFDPTTEDTLTGVFSEDVRVSTGFRGRDSRSPSEVLKSWHSKLIASIQSGDPGIDDIRAGKVWKLRVVAERLLMAEWNAARDPSAPPLSVHSARRFINLTIKSLRAHPELGPQLVDAIYEKGDAALNGPVVDLANDLLKKDFDYKSSEADPAKAATQYENAQAAIKKFCAEHGTKAVIFDIIARAEHLAKVE
ncbi:MAG TPA: hypothetical protein VJU59_35845 [Paraburkholderia sp.]|uniref:hypothetical protein n=1 Tax=Paraburkholderia sp. TaxID=1926495 RepID=UPI002B48A518|nr:hypothetical protein [Paraburkholderia sp.]HKR44984.1 hypothetical protein [Paraburkholderia sp.]